MPPLFGIVVQFVAAQRCGENGRRPAPAVAARLQTNDTDTPQSNIEVSYRIPVNLSAQLFDAQHCAETINVLSRFGNKE